MAVLLKNLVARAPQTEDFSAISELIAVCDCAKCGMANNSFEDLHAHWQQADFHLANDAWVIVTTRGQIVGFACIWLTDCARISTFVGVHPEYRARGIGTLLIRLVEERARQRARLVPPGVRVVLSGQVRSENREAQRLFEHEGYRRERQFLRISFTLFEDTGALPVLAVQKQLRADVSLEEGRILGATPLYDHDGLCSVQSYLVYEKELRPASEVDYNQEDMLDTMVGSC